ncbi:MAG: EI24 domain-containing protein [Alphaproteobacteria bacterium]|nr:EI24 domain-containing protein [Alphaproteobacteria bacterium]
MFDALFKTLGQLPTPPFQRVLWLSIGGSLLTAIILWFAIKVTLDKTDFIGLGWLDWIVDILGSLAAVVLLILLLPAFVGLIASLMLESICRAVEARHYPHLPEARSQSIMEAVFIGVRFMFILIALNIVVLPLIFFPPVYFVVGWALNGYLLGREYFELVGCRRLNADDLRTMRRQHGRTTLMAGLAIAVVSVIPIVNLILPLFGTAFMLHMFQRLPPITVRA